MKMAVGCVADNSKKYLLQALRLLLSFRWFGGYLASSNFYICIIDSAPPDFIRLYESYGAKVNFVSRFSGLNPQSNKLRYLELVELTSFDKVILLDCDTIIVREPVEFLSSYYFSAKISDGPTVSIDVFKKLFSFFNIELPQADQKCTVRGEPIIPYFNSGVLSFSRIAMQSLVPEWININRQLIDRIDLLESCHNFCDQASLSLAIARNNTKFKPLSNAYNFPAHYPEKELSSEFINTDPVIIHYHWLTDAKGFLKTTPYPNVNKRILEFNAKIKEELNNFIN